MRPPALNPDVHALFLDFDGTLTEIVPTPDAARLTASRRTRLEALTARFSGAVAILSGRSVADLDMRLPRDVWRAGGHGAEIAPPGEGAPSDPAAEERARDLTARLAPFAAAAPGVMLEPKRMGAALHFRARPQAERACLDALAEAAEAIGGFAVQTGKMVVEARPEGADKGAALARLAALPGFAERTPVMVGDDLTDEAAMAAAMALNGMAVKVGAGETAAPFRLADPREVHAWLDGCLAAAHRDGPPAAD